MRQAQPYLVPFVWGLTKVVSAGHLNHHLSMSIESSQMKGRPAILHINRQSRETNFQ